MKYVVLIGGGMADEALETLGNRSPLEAASIPNLDRIAADGRTGLVQPVRPGEDPCAEVALANLLDLGRAGAVPARGPLEAIDVEARLDEDTLALRVNLVHLFTDYQRILLADHTGGIETDAEGNAYIESLERDLGGGEFRFLPVGEYRGLLLWKGGPPALRLTPPHLILGAEVGPAMPEGEGSRTLHRLYNSAQMVLAVHPSNEERRKTGRTVVNSIWASGAGYRMGGVRPFYGTWGLKAGIMTRSAVLRGLAKTAGMQVCPAPEGDTSAEDWAARAAEFLKDGDLLVLTSDAGDRAAHRMDTEEKVRAIERFDELAGAVRDRLFSLGPCRLAVLPDHRTSPLDGKHARAPVPIAICGSGVASDRPKEYDERLLVRGSLRISDGRSFLKHLLKA